MPSEHVIPSLYIDREADYRIVMPIKFVRSGHGSNELQQGIRLEQPDHGTVGLDPVATQPSVVVWITDSDRMKLRQLRIVIREVWTVLGTNPIELISLAFHFGYHGRHDVLADKFRQTSVANRLNFISDPDEEIPIQRVVWLIKRIAC